MARLGLKKYAKFDLKQAEIMHLFIRNNNKTMVKKATVTQNATQIELAHDERTFSPMNLEFYALKC